MTSVGHTLTGLTLATAGMPLSASRWRMVWALNLCGVAANFPDLPFPGWGHDAYHVSQSLFVALGGVALLWGLFALVPTRERVGGWRAVGLASVAWLSHMLLDSFYSHGQGIAIFWPLSDAHLVLPVPWFHTIRIDPWQSAHNLNVFALELVCYGAVLAVAVAVRVRRLRQGAGTKRSRPTAPSATSSGR